MTEQEEDDIMFNKLHEEEYRLCEENTRINEEYEMKRFEIGQKIMVLVDKRMKKIMIEKGL